MTKPAKCRLTKRQAKELVGLLCQGFDYIFFMSRGQYVCIYAATKPETINEAYLYGRYSFTDCEFAVAEKSICIAEVLENAEIEGLATGWFE